MADVRGPDAPAPAAAAAVSSAGSSDTKSNVNPNPNTNTNTNHNKAHAPSKAAVAAARAEIDNPNATAFGLFDEFDLGTDWTHSDGDTPAVDHTAQSEFLGLANAMVEQVVSGSRSSAERLRATLNTRLVRVKGALERQKHELHRRIYNAPFMRLRDKVAFVLGLWSVGVICFWLGARPRSFYHFYTLVVPATVLIRLLRYRLKKWHYYLLDFCYFVNALLLVYLYAAPHSPSLFRALFVFAMGPLCWSVPLFRNSLVLHSLDKLTSVCIHLLPALCVWSIRWFAVAEPGAATATGTAATATAAPFTVCRSADCTNDTTAFDTVWLPLLLWALWAVLYYTKVFVLSARKVEERGYDTLFKYLTEDHASRVYRYVHALGDRWAHPLYMSLHMALFVLSGILSNLVFWHSFALHTLFLLVISSWSAWNGACFYMDFFAKRYELSLAQLTQTAQHIHGLAKQLPPAPPAPPSGSSAVAVDAAVSTPPLQSAAVVAGTAAHLATSVTVSGAGSASATDSVAASLAPAASKAVKSD